MAETIVTVILPLSLAYIMFTLGIGLVPQDFMNVAKYPRAFAIGVLNQMIFLPVVGFIIAASFGLPPILAAGVVLLALCPGGVTTNLLTKMANGNVALSVSLTAIVTLVSVITLPILLSVAMNHFMGQAAPDFSILSLSIKMFAIAVVPLAIGMVVRWIFPNIENSAGAMLSRLAVILFILIVLAAIASNWELLAQNFIKLGPSLLALLIITILLGWISGKLARLSPQDTTTIALESGVQNGTLAIAVAALVMPGEGLPAIGVPGGLYGPIMYLSLLFVYYRRETAHPPIQKKSRPKGKRPGEI